MFYKNQPTETEGGNPCAVEGLFFEIYCALVNIYWKTYTCILSINTMKLYALNSFFYFVVKAFDDPRWTRNDIFNSRL